MADPAAIVVCAWQAGEVIGAALGQVTPNGSAEISQVFVEHAWRGQYLGSQMAEALRQHFQARQVENIQVTLPIKEKRGTSFFASLGWQPATQTFVPKPPPTFGQVMQHLGDELREARNALKQKD